MTINLIYGNIGMLFNILSVGPDELLHTIQPRTTLSTSAVDERLAAGESSGAVHCGSCRATGFIENHAPVFGMRSGGILPPAMLLALLIYGYATGVFSSRKRESGAPGSATCSR